MSEQTPRVALQVKELKKQFGGTTAVKDVSFEVGYGEVVGFIGVNGAGKTTTLKMILGLLQPTSGTILIDGQDVKTKRTHDNISVLTELPAFYEAHSGRKNLKILLKGAQKYCTDETIDEELDRVEILEEGDRKVKEYSKGMRTRLGLAHVLQRKARIFVFDEPGTGLDPIGISFVRELMRSLADEGAAVLFSSHILSEVEAISDRVAIVHKGHMVAFDTLDKVRHMGLDKERFNVVVPNSDRKKAQEILAGKFGEIVLDDEGHLVVAADSGGEVNRALIEGDIIAESIAVNTNALDVIFRGLVENGNGNGNGHH